MPDGIDVASFQGSVDWGKVARSGVEFAICKATEGVGFTDPTFNATRLKAIADEGLRVGAYHFARPDTGGGSADARAEARYFVATVERAGGRFIDPDAWLRGDRGVLGVLDFEQPPFSASWAEVWAAEFRNLTGVDPAIYGGGYSLNPILSALGRFGFVWLAAYVADWRPYFRGNHDQVRMWQYSSSGSVPGIAGRVDVNEWVNAPTEVVADRAANLGLLTDPERTMCRRRCYHRARHLSLERAGKKGSPRWLAHLGWSRWWKARIRAQMRLLVAVAHTSGGWDSKVSRDRHRGPRYQVLARHWTGKAC